MKKKLVFIFILSLAFLLVACGGKKGSLEGTIVERGTENPITEEVTLVMDSQTNTTSDGEFLFTDIAAGKHYLQASADGYQEYSQEVSIKAGKKVTHKVELVEALPPLIIEDAEVPTHSPFPWGVDDDQAYVPSISPFYMAKHQVTYELWKKVYDWATSDARGSGKYNFANEGVKGNDDDAGKSDRHPVTTINWRDAVVWCNALTEYYNSANGANLECVYIDSGDRIIRSSVPGGMFHITPYVKEGAKGYRLPESPEWEFTARYRGDDSTNTVAGYEDPYFTKGNSASGAIAAYSDETASGAVAWYSVNSGDSTKEVGGKGANALGIFDMSGNVFEWTFSLSSGIAICRGGAYNSTPTLIRIGYIYTVALNQTYPIIGFRVARSK